MRGAYRLATLPILIVLFAAALEAGPIPLTPRPQEERVYVGTVAGQPAVAELTFSESEILRGRFFYRRFGHDIVLEPDSDATRFLECGSFEAGNYILRNEPCAPTGIWDVTVDPGTIRGRWHSESDDPKPKAKRPSKPILLTRANDSSFGAYDRLRLSDNRIREVETKFAGNVAWRIVREDRSGVQRPILILGPDPLAMSCINAALENEFHDEIVTQLEDQPSGSEVSVVFVNERLFSITSENEFWGGAHPSNGFGARTFDLRTGDEVRWNEVLRLTDGASASRLDLRRQDLIAADVLREAVRLQATEDGDCFSEVAAYYACEREICSLAAPALEPEHWTFHPTEKGLAVAVDVYPEAGRGCRGEVVVVPWELARKALRRPMPLP